MSPQTCAVIGGGINGVMAAWELARAGYGVELFEKGRLMGGTSSASTKLIHGGLRYLETGQFRLVREALQERAWWVSHAPDLVRPIRLLLPVYGESERPRWQLKLGLLLYDLLAAGSGFPRHCWLSRQDVLAIHPTLKAEGLKGAFSFHDAQMDDLALGAWAAEQARRAGAVLHEGTEAIRLDRNGSVTFCSGTRQFDHVVNVAGPLAEQLLEQASISHRVQLDLVRGSHIVFDAPCPAGCLLQVPGEKRIFFVLPYQGRTLVGTTEVRQGIECPIRCSADEVSYLLNAYNHYFCPPRTSAHVAANFSGLRPLIRSTEDPGRATREYAIERHGRLVTVFGGKWTTARKLGLAVVQRLGEKE